MEKDELIALADSHERRGVSRAEQAMSDATWYRDQAADTRRAADHFAVAAALRARAEDSEGRG